MVDVCTPTYLHKDHVLQAWRQGPCDRRETLRAVPGGRQEMFALAQKKGLHLYVARCSSSAGRSRSCASWWRSSLRQALDASFSACPPARLGPGGWLFDRSKSGLVPFDLHIHDLDVIASLFGVPQEAQCWASGGGEEQVPELYRWEYQCGQVHVAAEAGC